METTATIICEWQVLFASISKIYFLLRLILYSNSNIHEIGRDLHYTPSWCLIFVISFLCNVVNHYPFRNCVFFLDDLAFFLALKCNMWEKIRTYSLWLINIQYLYKIYRLCTYPYDSSCTICHLKNEYSK